MRDWSKLPQPARGDCYGVMNDGGMCRNQAVPGTSWCRACCGTAPPPPRCSACHAINPSFATVCPATNGRHQT